MANPFREGGSLNIPTQDAADEMNEISLGYMIFCISEIWPARSEWVAEQATWAN
jgi:hypothetical protein